MFPDLLSTAPVPWNVKIPESLEAEVLRCLDSVHPAPALASLIKRFPNFGEKIALWADQAKEFHGIATVSPVSSQSFPSHIGDYRIIQLLGTGGFGSVYPSQHPRHERPGSIKILKTLDPPVRSP